MKNPHNSGRAALDIGYRDGSLVAEAAAPRGGTGLVSRALNVVVTVLALTCVSAWGGTAAASAEGETSKVDSLQSAEPAIDECLVVDVDVTYKAKWLGKSADNHYPMNGKTPTRVDLQVQVNGHGNASISKQNSTAVVVHYWYDLFTELNYTLKVWVEC